MKCRCKENGWEPTYSRALGLRRYDAPQIDEFLLGRLGVRVAEVGKRADVLPGPHVLRHPDRRPLPVFLRRESAGLERKQNQNNKTTGGFSILMAEKKKNEIETFKSDMDCTSIRRKE